MNIKNKIKKEFEINERDYLHEYHSFGYIDELIDFIVKEKDNEIKKEIDKLTLEKIKFIKTETYRRQLIDFSNEIKKQLGD